MPACQPFRMRALRIGLSLALMALPGCSVPGPRASRAQTAALQRSSVPIPTAAGRETSYLHAGDPSSPLLIYIHGTPGDAGAWADYLVEPVPGFESIAVDRLGFGGSVTSRDPQTGKARQTPVPSFSEQAQAIASLLHRRHGRGAILVGHSLGGPIAAQLAADHPDLVDGLVILAGSLDPDQEVWAWYNEAATWSAVNWMIPRAMRTANTEVTAAKRQTQLLAEVLDRITCPVVWVQGGADSLVPRENEAYGQRMLTSAFAFELIELPRAGHFLPWEHEDVVRRAIERAAALAVDRRNAIRTGAEPSVGSTQPAPQGRE